MFTLHNGTVEPAYNRQSLVELLSHVVIRYHNYATKIWRHNRFGNLNTKKIKVYKIFFVYSNSHTKKIAPQKIFCIDAMGTRMGRLS